MTAKELINKGKVAVRNSGTLYPLYQEIFKEAFGYFPECPTCGSVNGHKQWEAFTSYVNGADPNTLLTQKITTMANNKTTFAVKNKNIIYSYNFKKEGQDRLFTARMYGDVMTEDFAVAYLDNAGDDEELLNKRKAEFSILPKKYAETSEDSELSEDTGKDLSKLKLAELQQIATDKGYPTEEWEKLRSKAEVIDYLEAKDLDKGDDLI